MDLVFQDVEAGRKRIREPGHSYDSRLATPVRDMIVAVPKAIGLPPAETEKFMLRVIATL
jgi:hypothetical protein